MSLLTRAFEFAQVIHDGQTRKDGRTLYLSHPMAVAALVLKFGGSEAQAASALLHDTIEDPKATPVQIRELFGEEVANLTSAFMDPVQEGDWQTRRKAYLEKVSTLPEAAVLVVGCEEFHELQDLMQDLRLFSPVEVWKRYPSHAMNICWYFKEIMVLMNTKITHPNGKKLVTEFASSLKVLQEKVFEGA